MQAAAGSNAYRRPTLSRVLRASNRACNARRPTPARARKGARPAAAALLSVCPIPASCKCGADAVFTSVLSFLPSVLPAWGRLARALGVQRPPACSNAPGFFSHTKSIGLNSARTFIYLTPCFTSIFCGFSGVGARWGWQKRMAFGKMGMEGKPAWFFRPRHPQFSDKLPVQRGHGKAGKRAGCLGGQFAGTKPFSA